jgi:hypothetical protein
MPSALLATSGLGEPTPFSDMISQPHSTSGQLIPVKINRVRDAKTRRRADRTTFMNFLEFVRVNSAILEKSDENFPSCRTVVKRSARTYSAHRIKIHSGAKLSFQAFLVSLGKPSCRSNW